MSKNEKMKKLTEDFKENPISILGPVMSMVNDIINADRANPEFGFVFVVYPLKDTQETQTAHCVGTGEVPETLKAIKKVVATIEEGTNADTIVMN